MYISEMKIQIVLNDLKANIFVIVWCLFLVNLLFGMQIINILYLLILSQVALLAAEKRALADVDQIKEQHRKLIEAERKERRKLADEEALRKIRSLEEQVSQLKQSIASQKQEEVLIIMCFVQVIMEIWYFLLCMYCL